MKKRLIELLIIAQDLITLSRKADFLIANDVVPVVRCKDCKYYREGEIFDGIKFCFRLLGSDCKPVGYNFSDDDFCSRGERRTE